MKNKITGVRLEGELMDWVNSKVNDHTTSSSVIRDAIKTAISFEKDDGGGSVYTQADANRKSIETFYVLQELIRCKYPDHERIIDGGIDECLRKTYGKGYKICE